MRSFARLAGFVIALGWGQGVAAAQWSAVETQEIAQGAEATTNGTAIAISGTTALVTAPLEDLTRVYEIDPVTGVWNETAGIPQGGIAAAISGATAILGSGTGALDGMGANPGHAYVFDRMPAGWIMVASLVDPDPWPGFWGEGSFGSAVAISGDTVIVGAQHNDAAYVFERDLGGHNAWGYAAKLSFGDQGILFGASVGLVGGMALVGAPMEQGIGAVLVFERQGASGPWIQTAKLLGSGTAPYDYFGSSLGLSGTTALVGAAADVPFNSPPGAAYVFERVGSAWLEVAKLTASSTGPGQAFGDQVALDADTAVVLDSEALALCVFKRNHGGVEAWGEIAVLPAARSSGVAVAGGQVAVLDKLPGVSIPAIRGLALDPTTGLLYGSILNDDQLVAIDPASGFTTVIGSTGFPDIEGLAFDPVSGVLYGADDVGDQLVRIDVQTGAGTVIGPFGYSAVRGLEFDAATNSLFGTDTGVDQLLRIDASTGDATVIGSLGFTNVLSLAMDSATGTLYGVNSGGSVLVAIDPETGAGTAIGPGSTQAGLVGIEGLAMDPASGKLLGVDGGERLVEIDTETGLGTAQEALWSDLIWVSVNAVAHTSETYCTAGTSASGCQALIGASGAPSASAASGFVVSASGVEGSKDGMFFFGTFGQQASPWGNGTSYQCVKPPLKRTGLLSGSGTTGACNGSFARDLNAFWCSACPGSAVKPPAGAMGQAQLWYRDPASTSNQSTSLSDAVEFYVTP